MRDSAAVTQLDDASDRSSRDRQQVKSPSGRVYASLDSASSSDDEVHADTEPASRSREPVIAAVHGLGETVLDIGDQMDDLTATVEARLHQVEEQLAQVSDDAAEGADGVFMVDALRAEMQRLEASVTELASRKPVETPVAALDPSSDQIAVIARAVASELAHASTGAVQESDVSAVHVERARMLEEQMSAMKSSHESELEIVQAKAAAQAALEIAEAQAASSRDSLQAAQMAMDRDSMSSAEAARAAARMAQAESEAAAHSRVLEEKMSAMESAHASALAAGLAAASVQREAVRDT